MMNPITKLLHQFEFPHENGDAVVPPILASSYFTARSYEEWAERSGRNDRLQNGQPDNPTVEILEQKLAVLENGESCRCFASGPAAIAGTILAFVKSGDHVLCMQNVSHLAHPLFHEYLPRFGVEVTFVDGSREADIEQALKENTVLIYLESPSPCLFSMHDLRAIAGIAQSRGIITAIDNTWATPLFQNPLDHGIDLVIHSSVEYLSGHSDMEGGAVIGSMGKVKQIKEKGADVHGAVLSPVQAWFMLRGLRTLAVRMRRYQQSSLQIARMLQDHPAVEKVYYPGAPEYGQQELADRYLRGFSGVMSVALKGTEAHVKRFVNALRLFRIGVGWGGYNSTVTPLGSDSLNNADEMLVRLSIGLEDTEDLKIDLLRALDYALTGKGGDLLE
jgi:cystathionine beta-lyase/cystathionine gamma-synthase